MSSSMSGSRFPSFLWPLLLVSSLVLGFVFTVIQPLTAPPDESAHFQYAQFLADNGRFPLFNAQGGGEGGYESQHPPLYYAGAALVYKVTSGLTENWRWYAIRWATLLVEIGALFLVCRRFFRELWPNAPWLAWYATATVLWMPLTLLYAGYANPDGLVLVWAAVVLATSLRVSREPVTLKESALLGLWCALALLTKLSGAPLVVVACFAQLWAGKEKLLPRLGATLGTVALIAGPWYLRNLFLYGSPFIHTQGKLGTGLQLAERAGTMQTALFTWQETYLSTWVQRGWFPPGLDVLFYGVIVAGTALAVVGLIIAKGKGKKAGADGDENDKRAGSDEALRRVLNLCGILVVLVFLGQQWAFWTQDVEFNAGGRYMLAAMSAISLLLFVGWNQLGAWARKIWIPLWLVTLLVMSAVSIDNITGVLTPKYFPKWQMFQFPN